MEEDWDSPTGFSPVDSSAAQSQNTQSQWDPFENHRSPQRSRGRGFWKENPSDQNNWRSNESDSRDFGQGGGDQIRSQTFHRSSGFGENDRRPGPRGRGVLRDNFDDSEGSRRGRGSGFGQSQGRGFGQSRGGGFGQSRDGGFGQSRDEGFGQSREGGFGQSRGGGFGQSRDRPNWRDKEEEGGDSSSRVVMQVESSLVGRIIGMDLPAIREIHNF